MRGIYTALISPFTPSDDIDLQAFRRILADQKAAGVSGVVVNGTTGESPCLTLSEKKALIEIALTELSGSGVQVIAGTGTNNTRESVEFSRWASNAGVDAVLLVTPYYNKPSQSGLEQHFLKIADAIDCDAILYNVPGRTAVSLSIETIVSLAAHPKISALKEASGNVAFTSDLLDHLAAHQRSLHILSGDDPTFLALLTAGAVGNISVASNLIPRAMVEIQNNFEQGHNAAATALHRSYWRLFRDLFVEPNPVPIKAAMALHGFCTEAVRLPLCGLSARAREQLEATLRHCHIQAGAAL